MRSLVTWGKAWAIVAIANKLAVAVAVLIIAAAFAFGDGGTLIISWNPGEP